MCREWPHGSAFFLFRLLRPASVFELFPLEYDFVAPQKNCVWLGASPRIGVLAATLGKRAFVVSGSRTLEKNGLLAELLQALESAQVEAVHVASISHEPEVCDVDVLAAQLFELNAEVGDLVIGIGGGSAIDLAKAAAAMATNCQSSSVADYLEGVGRGYKISSAPLPILAVPTTSGTGSEATKNAVISSYDPPFKKSLRADSMVPRIVLVDPELSVSVPPEVTAHTGMDAITQLIESYISRRTKPIPRDVFARLATGDSEFSHGGEKRIASTGARSDGPCRPAFRNCAGQFRLGAGSWRGRSIGRRNAA